MMRQQVRQGDVLLIPVEALPAAPRAMAVKGNYLLALGEVTGHAHYVCDLEAVMLQANEEMAQFAAQRGVEAAQALLLGGVFVTAREGTTLYHGTPTAQPEGPADGDHDFVHLGPGAYLALRPREYTDENEFRIVAD